MQLRHEQQMNCCQSSDVTTIEGAAADDNAGAADQRHPACEERLRELTPT